jgi:hypothetical protein
MHGAHCPSCREIEMIFSFAAIDSPMPSSAPRSETLWLFGLLRRNAERNSAARAFLLLLDSPNRQASRDRRLTASSMTSWRLQKAKRTKWAPAAAWS